jgi:hypothetical protein
MVYSALFGLGKFLLLQWSWGIVYSIAFATSTIGVKLALGRMDAAK